MSYSDNDLSYLLSVMLLTSGELLLRREQLLAMKEHFYKTSFSSVGGSAALQILKRVEVIEMALVLKVDTVEKTIEQTAAFHDAIVVEQSPKTVQLRNERITQGWAQEVVQVEGVVVQHPALRLGATQWKLDASDPTLTAAEVLTAA